MTETLHQIVLAARPEGAPKPTDFRLETGAVPAPNEGEVLVRVHYFSLDPYMRGRMDDAKSYAAPVPIGGRMEAGGVGQVITSRSRHFAEGDIVFGMTGWATHCCIPANQLRKLDKSVPMTVALGVLGMPGFTGWYGLTELGRPKAGETLVVAAATGPVGSMVGQIAKLRGMRVVGIAGGAEKCATAVNTFGFDECLDHRAYEDAKDLRAALNAACPSGVDVYFENVGGKVFEAVLPLMNVGGRIPLCGMISWYNAGALGANAGGAKDNLPKLWRTILVNRLSVSGFIISDQWDQLPKFLQEVAPLVVSGKVKYIEDIADGIQNAPAAFMNMLMGGNHGKQIVKVI